MTPEQLLKPRYKVIADYPKSIYNIGDIINAGTTSEDCIYCDRDGPRMRQYPHLFKPLQWWEERKGDEPPMYIRSNGIVYRVDKWSKSFQDIHWLGCLVNKTKYISCEELTPATDAEYEAYTQTTNQLNHGQEKAGS